MSDQFGDHWMHFETLKTREALSIMAIIGGKRFK